MPPEEGLLPETDPYLLFCFYNNIVFNTEVHLPEPHGSSDAFYHFLNFGKLQI